MFKVNVVIGSDVVQYYSKFICYEPWGILLLFFFFFFVVVISHIYIVRTRYICCIFIYANVTQLLINGTLFRIFIVHSIAVIVLCIFNCDFYWNSKWKFTFKFKRKNEKWFKYYISFCFFFSWSCAFQLHNAIWSD